MDVIYTNNRSGPGADFRRAMGTTGGGKDEAAVLRLEQFSRPPYLDFGLVRRGSTKTLKASGGQRILGSREDYIRASVIVKEFGTFMESQRVRATALFKLNARFRLQLVLLGTAYGRSSARSDILVDVSPNTMADLDATLDLGKSSSNSLNRRTDLNATIEMPRRSMQRKAHSGWNESENVNSYSKPTKPKVYPTDIGCKVFCKMHTIHHTDTEKMGEAKAQVCDWWDNRRVEAQAYRNQEVHQEGQDDASS
eukprot:752988-Amorphochlora_amoeboformis.AAC.1